MDRSKNTGFSVVIPTMWMSEKINIMIPKYQNSELVKEIIIIDNKPEDKINLENFSKLKYYTEGKNIFVNPAWNIGNLLSNYELILVNDDILIDDIDPILNLLLNSDFGIVGVKIGEKNGNMMIQEINDFPKNHFGSFMYIRNYFHIPNNIKIWFGDNLQFYSNKKKGVLINSGIMSNESKTVLSTNNAVINEVYLRDKELYHKLKPTINITEVNNQKLSVLVVLVNYGEEQIEFLKKVIKELKSFVKYNVKIIVNSNIDLSIEGIDHVNVYDNLTDYQLLPITCRKTLWENRNDYDLFIFGENDHLFLEKHLDKHIEYSKILPKNKISGLIQYEKNDDGKFYPAYHKNYDWDFNSVEIYGGKLFAHFTNLHQATFILTKEQMLTIGSKYDFSNFYGPKTNYSVKCRVNTDIYEHSDLKKVICISDFKENLIHHLPNLYINGDKGRNKNQRAEETKMNNSLIKLFNFDKKKIVCGLATVYERKDSLKLTVSSIINQVDELIIYQNDYKEIFDFLNNEKIKVISSLDTNINMGDAGKFYTVDSHKDCYYLSIDDDIIYPKDYVTSIVEGIKKFDNKKIVTHHGRSFNENAKDYYKDYTQSVHFNHKLSKHKEIHFPGTGVMGFYTETFNIKFSDFKYKNIADIIVGIEAAKQNISCVCLPHDSNWLNDSGINKINDTLFEKNKYNKELNNYFSSNLKYFFKNNGVKNINISYDVEKEDSTTNLTINPVKPELTKKEINYDKINSIFSNNNPKIITKPQIPQNTNNLKLNSETFSKIQRPKKRFR